MKDLKLILEECDRHLERLLYSKRKIESWGNIESDLFEDPDKVETLDSFIFRFSKLQDSMGEKLFPSLLEFLGEEVRNKPFIDILNRLEKLELIPSAEKWKELRELRNLLTHTYPWQRKELIELIKRALSLSEDLTNIYMNLKEFLKNRLG